MINLEIFSGLLIFFGCIEYIRTIDLGFCQPSSVPCKCGNTGISLHFTVKQCSHFYKWEHSCDFCDGFNEENFCSKFKYCLECDTESQTCSTCSPDRFGQLCTGICSCQNGGTCIKSNGACVCPPKFEGNNCEIKKLASCPTPEKLPRGRYSTNGIIEGSTISYECNEGFFLDGQKSRTCTEAGVWSESLPTCTPFCVKPKPSPNLIETVVELLNNVVGALTSLLGGATNNPIKSISYKCADGFQLVGATTITCKKNGRWSDPLPLCKAICPTLHPPINGSMIGESFIEDAVVEFKCNSKFLLDGSSKSTCLNDGTWNAAIPKCVQRTLCPVLDNITYGERETQNENGEITDNQIIVEGFSTIVHCNKDYILQGSAERSCQKNGTWSGNPATCIKWVQTIDCKMRGRDVVGEVGEFVRIDCPPGCFGASNVIGTGIYSQSSLVCRAAIHIGKIPTRGGTIYVVNNGKFSPFVSSLLNGIQSLRTTKSTDSFRFADFEKEHKEINKEMSCPFGWELFDNICLHFQITNYTWNEAKIYCEDIQGHLVILHEADNHFALSTAMEAKGIPKAWIGLENKDEFSWIDGKLLINGDFDAWLQDEPQANKTCVYTSTSGWATENCEIPLHFVCQFEKQDVKNNEIFCQDPSPLDNGVSSTDGLANLVFTEGAIVNYSCNQYYNLQGPSHIYCLENGTWSQATPSCQFVPSCPEPPKLDDGNILNISPPDFRQKRQVSRFVIINKTDTKELIDDMELSNRTEEDTLSFENESLFFRNDYETENDTFLFNNETNSFENETSFFKEDDGESEKRATVKPNFRNLRNRISRINFRNLRSENEAKPESIKPNFPIPPNHYHVGTKVRYTCESQFYDFIGSKTATCQSNGKWTGIRTCEPVCGKTSFPRPPLVINGNISEVGQWPWQAGIATNRENQWQINCGGSLLRKNWILTAAHCVTFGETISVLPLEYLVIYLGKHYRNSSKDDDYVQTFKAEEIMVHPQYNPIVFDFDIALIKLNATVQLNHRVQPICLPTAGNLETTERLQEGQKGIVIGWGKTEDETEAEELRFASVPLVSKKKCEMDYNEAGFPFLITERMYCAGFEEGLKDACSGDSGGPMVFHSGAENKGTWIIEGIVSWGSPKGCAFPKHYGGYTRVERFVEWINHHM